VSAYRLVRDYGFECPITVPEPEPLVGSFPVVSNRLPRPIRPSQGAGALRRGLFVGPAVRFRRNPLES